MDLRCGDPKDDKDNNVTPSLKDAKDEFSPLKRTMVGDATHPGPEPQHEKPQAAPIWEIQKGEAASDTHLRVEFGTEGNVGHLRRSEIKPNQSTDRIRYIWQGKAPGETRYASADMTCSTAALHQWYMKWGHTLTERSREQLKAEIERRKAPAANASSSGGIPPYTKRRSLTPIAF